MLLESYRLPAPRLPLPIELGQCRLLRWKTEEFPFAAEVAKILGCGEHEMGTLHTVNPEHELLRGMAWYKYPNRGNKKMNTRTRASAKFCDAYERFIQQVVAPYVLSFLPHDEQVLLYQFPPTLRVHPPSDPPRALGRMHHDAEYGHQPGEVNLWMPLAGRAEGNTALWVESEPNLGDFSAWEMDYGQVGLFNGVECRHMTQPNDSGRTRVSMDFRVAPEACFDASWQLPKLTYRHEYRRYELTELPSV